MLSSEASDAANRAIDAIDARAAAALIFNNRNALITDADTTARLRALKFSERSIADGFTMASQATISTPWADPASDAVQFAVATIENDLRLGASVATIIKILRAQMVFDPRLSESVIAEGFRQAQVKRLPPPAAGPPSPSASSGSGLSRTMIASLAIGGAAAAVGAVVYSRRRRAGRFAS